MSLPLSTRFAVLVWLAALGLCRVVAAQDATPAGSAPLPKYDDGTAAGTPSYSDATAAGTAATPAEAGAKGAVPEKAETVGAAGTGTGAAAGAAAAPGEGAGVFDWEDGATTGEAGAAAGAAAAKEEGQDKRLELHTWEWGAYRHQPNLAGSTGLLHIIEAGSDQAGTFGLGIAGAWFRYDDYLIKRCDGEGNCQGDTNNYMWGSAHLRVTPLKFLEFHLGLQSSANYNNRVQPVLFQALGDLELGIKGYFSPVKFWTVGGEVGLFFVNPVGEVSVAMEGTSVGLMALNSFDFAELSRDVPIRAHLNLGYRFDNSSNVVEDIEKKRGGCGVDLDGDGEIEYKGCLNPVERFALDINRNDIFTLGIGVDAALPYVSPILEYVLEIPVNRQDFTCPESAPGSADSCMSKEGGSAFRQLLTIGARVFLPLETLSLDVGVDIGLTGYAPTVQELAAQVPYRVMFGASYSFDPFLEPPPPIVAPPVAVEPSPPPAVIAGFVHDAAAPDRAVAGAVVTYAGQQLNPQITDSAGKFRSYPLPAGTLSVSVSSPEYKDASFTVEVPATGDIALDCPLETLPRKVQITVRVVDQDNKPVSGASVKIDGPTTESGTTADDGTFKKELGKGSYSVEASKDGYFKKEKAYEVGASMTGEVEVQINAKPTKPLVIIQKKQIRIKKQIHFATGSADILPDSFALLEEIAAVMNEHSELKLIQIQGHTDDKGKRDYNVDLSQRRADSVRQHLVDAGVSSSRLEAKGLGPDKPLAPNFTAQGRAKNRRVEFHIIERE